MPFLCTKAHQGQAPATGPQWLTGTVVETAHRRCVGHAFGFPVYVDRNLPKEILVIQTRADIATIVVIDKQEQ
jgi:hypothetical protein